MKYNDLRWSHLAHVLEHLARGARTSEATKAAGFTPNVWARVRKSWDELPAHLAAVDPQGAEVDLTRIDALIRLNLAQGGRPVGSKNAAGSKRQGTQRTLPTLIVTNPGFYVEDGRIMLEDD